MTPSISRLSLKHEIQNLNAGRILAWVVLSTLIAFTLLPLWMVLKTALVQPSELFSSASDLLPNNPTVVNFEKVLGMISTQEALTLGGSGAEINFVRALFNSVLFTAITVTLQTSFAAMAAYAFARLRFPGQQCLFGLFVASMMVPGVVTLIPNFILIRDLGWLNTMAGMVAPFCLMQGFSIYFLRQFFLSVPRDLEEAALLEGASHFSIFWRVVIPLSITPIATIATLTGINMWNEFFWPYLVGRDELQQVLPVALQAFKSQTPQGQPDWTGLMSATTLAVLPTILMLLAFGRQVVESVQFTGGK